MQSVHRIIPYIEWVGMKEDVVGIVPNDKGGRPLSDTVGGNKED